MLNSTKKQNNRENKDIGSQKIVQFANNPNEKTFIKYYEQNIRIKKQLDEKNKYINDLKKKLEHQINLNKTVSNPYQQINQLKNELKKPNLRHQSGNKKGGKPFYNTMTGGGESKKVENLLQIIEHYKSKLMLAEEESANLRRQKILLQQDLQIKGRAQKDWGMSEQEGSMRKDVRKEQELSIRLKQKISQFENEKQKNIFMEAQMRRLQTIIKTMQMNQDQLHQLKVQNQKLENRIMKLTSLNSDNSESNSIRATEQKARQLQLKLKSGMDKYAKVKQQNMKLNIDYKLQNNKLIELQYLNQQLQKQNLELKKNQINDPIVKRLLQDKEFLAKIIGEIQKPKSLLTDASFGPNQTKQNLIFEKQQLAKDLIQARNKIKTMQQNWREKETLLKIQKQQIMNKASLLPSSDKTSSYTSKQGIPYDGDISMFSDEKISITNGINFFDIFLGQINLIQTIIKSITNMSSSNNPLIMATVDFYNFNTVNTKLIQGLASNLNSQFTFKIAEDEFFYKYLNKGNFKIDFWAAEGNKNHHLGSVQVPLKQIFLKNKPNIAPVINTSTPILLSQKIVGTIHFDMRMRFPIYQQASRILNSDITGGQGEDKAIKRKLIIQIQQGFGFSPTSNLFVYYPFRLQDYYTKTSKGSEPKWSHYKMLDINYNQDTKNYLKKNQLEFTIFDDNAVLYDEKDTDVVGSGSISLAGLIDSTSSEKPIRQRLQIKKNGVKMGVIDVKIFWYESKEKAEGKQGRKKGDLMIQIHNDVLKYIKDINSTAEMEFKRIDRNGTGMISYDQFLMWITKVKQSFKYSQQIIQKYYETYKQPLNLINWMDRLRRRGEDEKRPEDLMQQLGMINQILRKNSVQISNQVSLRQFLKNKKLFQVTLDIDQDNNGYISKKELMKYMKDHNIILDDNEILSDQIKLIDFLKKYTNQ